MGAMNVGQSSPYLEAFSMAKGSAAIIFRIIDRKPVIDSFSETGSRPASTKGGLELRKGGGGWEEWIGGAGTGTD